MASSRPVGSPEPLLSGIKGAEAVSEEELQWRARKVEQEANHDLRHLVTLLDLDSDQQDRIFQTLARRSADWHPLLRSTIIEDGAADIGSSAMISAPSANHSPETASSSSPDLSSSPAPSPANSGNPSAAVDTPLTDALAPDLTLAQQTALAEDQLDRQEWWESIIPRLLPDDGDGNSDTDTGDVYAAPPDESVPADSTSPGTASPASE